MDENNTNSGTGNADTPDTSGDMRVPEDQNMSGEQTDMPANSASAANTTSNGPKRGVMLGIIALAILVIGAGGVIATRGVSGLGSLFSGGSVSTGDIVAQVNNANITATVFNARLSQVGFQYGVDTEDDAIKNQVLDSLINEVLMAQAALALGEVVTETEIDEQMVVLEGQVGGKEALEAQLATNNITMAFFRDNIREQLLLQKFVVNQTGDANIEVSDEEVQNYYDTFVAPNEDAPELEDVRQIIVSQLEQEKIAQILDPIIAQLRAEADISVEI